MNRLLLVLTVAFAILTGSCNGQTNKDIEQLKSDKSSSPFKWDKIDESSLGSCRKVTKVQMAIIDKVFPILFKEYNKINEFEESLEFVYTDVEKYSPLILDFIRIERVCCPAYTLYMKFSPNSNTVSLIVGGSKKIKELAKDYTKG